VKSAWELAPYEGLDTLSAGQSKRNRSVITTQLEMKVEERAASSFQVDPRREICDRDSITIEYERVAVRELTSAEKRLQQACGDLLLLLAFRGCEGSQVTGKGGLHVWRPEMKMPPPTFRRYQLWAATFKNSIVPPAFRGRSPRAEDGKRAVNLFLRPVS
jgi:hypothetical protein